MISINQNKYHITILSPQQLQSELISKCLSEAEMDVSVDFGQLCPPKSADSCHKWLVAIDCIEKDDSAIRKTIKETKLQWDRTALIILFNVHSNLMGKIESNALELGVHGIFYLNDGLDCFLKGITKVFNGELWFSRQIMSNMLKNQKKLNSTSVFMEPVSSLTSREKEIIRWIVQGYKNRDIATVLHVSEHTVKTHIYNIYKKIDVPNRFQAVLWASQYFTSLS